MNPDTLESRLRDCDDDDDGDVVVARVDCVVEVDEMGLADDDTATLHVVYGDWFVRI